MVVCSPNYLHDSHVRFGLRIGANVICEKPLVLNPESIAPLEKLEMETGKSVFNIFQLRLHPAIIALKKRVEESPAGKVYDLDLTYITSLIPGSASSAERKLGRLIICRVSARHERGFQRSFADAGSWGIGKRCYHAARQPL